CYPSILHANSLGRGPISFDLMEHELVVIGIGERHVHAVAGMTAVRDHHVPIPRHRAFSAGADLAGGQSTLLVEALKADRLAFRIAPNLAGMMRRHAAGVAKPSLGD